MGNQRTDANEQRVTSSKASNKQSTETSSSGGKEKKGNGILDRMKNEPVFLASVGSTLVIFLVTIVGMDAIQAEQSVNLLLYFLTLLGIGAGTGLGARQYVDGPRNRNNRNE